MGPFDNKYMFRVHMVQIILVLAALSVTGVRLLTTKSVPGVTPSRAKTMALGVGAKSLIIIIYELATSHTKKFRKWHSLMANMILNCLEQVF
ncbi:hypothetical protein LSUE1_G001137 [Lachnellula suecica]|uniref:Uncharacterized protein n=1 Tax=Lachnellula suecica TaxID=602035 RepID=A0A8T9CEN9_9HELO|nr:hypothetical protein LSUE1_G001137 [Lachnellula suecica]